MTHPELRRRMYNEAVDRIHDASIISDSLRARSDSQSIIRILGFEVLLKCALLICHNRLFPSHDYVRLWSKLPLRDQEVILVEARNRDPGASGLQDVDKVLSAYEHIFLCARYSYELYKDLSDDQVRERGERWLEEEDGDSEKADFSYYPSELTSLLCGLMTFIEDRLGLPRADRSFA